jgi:hypothetical protein
MRMRRKTQAKERELKVTHKYFEKKEVAEAFGFKEKDLISFGLDSFGRFVLYVRDPNGDKTYYYTDYSKCRWNEAGIEILPEDPGYDKAMTDRQYEEFLKEKDEE